MSVIDRLACKIGRNDEVPNQELARDIAEKNDAEGLKEIVSHLTDRDKSVANDCIKVVYETGYLKPEMLAPYAGTFLDLLDSKNNRMVWGAMIALSVAAPFAADAVMPRVRRVVDALNDGSVITVDNAVKTLSRLAATNAARRKELLPLLIDFLRQCRAKSVPQYCEEVVTAVTDDEVRDFTAVLVGRDDEYNDSQRKRVLKVVKQAAKIAGAEK